MTEFSGIHSEVFNVLMHTLDQVLVNDAREQFCVHFANAISVGDNEAIVYVLTQDLANPLVEDMFAQIVETINDETFEMLVVEVQQILDFLESHMETDVNQVELERVKHSYQFLMNTEKGKRVKIRSKQRKLIQLKEKINRLLDGDQAILHDHEVMASLPVSVDQFLDRGKVVTAEAIIHRLGQNLLSDDRELRAQIAGVMVGICKRLFSEQRLEIMRRASHKLIKWMELEDHLTPDMEKIAIQLQSLTKVLIRDGRISESRHILKLFNDIYCGKLPKPEPIRQLAETVLRDMVSEPYLEAVVEDFLHGTPQKSKEAVYKLIHLGANSAPVLLGRLQASKNREERIRILKVLSNIGQAAIPAITQQLNQEDPWYFVRNLALLIGRIGDKRHLHLLKPQLFHEDRRVRKETINSIYQVGGPESAEILLAALSEADTETKVMIVEILGVMEYEMAVEPLIAIIREDLKPNMEPKQIELLEKTCTALGQLGCGEAVPVLKQLIKNIEKIDDKSLLKDLIGYARDALGMICSIKVTQDQSSDSPQKDVSKEVKVSRQEEIIRKYVDQNDETVETSAVTLMYNLIIRYAKAKEFEKAEAIRQRLMKLDPMAFSEIIQSGEVIEAEKTGVKIKDHREIWFELYDFLDPDEGKALYQAMEVASYEPDQTVFQQGERDTKLIFINHGRLKLIYGEKGREILVKTLGAGDIAGEDAFFPNTSYTASLVTLTESEVCVLNRSVLHRYRKEFPALEPKLVEYCRRLEKVKDLLVKFGEDRRTDRRVRLSGKIEARLIGTDGKPENVGFTGELINISSGGLTFSVPMEKGKAIQLLSRQLNTRFVLPVDKNSYEIDHNGIVVAIHNQDTNTSSIHVQFIGELTELSPEDANYLKTVLPKISPETSKNNEDDFLKTKL